MGTQIDVGLAPYNNNNEPYLIFLSVQRKEAKENIMMVGQLYCLAQGICMLDKEHHGTLPVTKQDHKEVLLVGLQVILQDIIGSALASPVTDLQCESLS